MSCCNTCGCNNSSCGCNYVVNIESLDGSADSYQNINLTGIGVLDSAAAGVVNFRGIASGNGTLTVSLDNTNHVVLLTVDTAAIVAAIPQATTTVSGIGETATNAEALAKASITTFVTPSNFAAMGSTDTFAGLVELATDAEALAGVSTTLAVTPANLAVVNATQLTTRVFADAVARAATAPAFAGQYGYQLDSKQTFIGGSTVAGEWYPIPSTAATWVLDNGMTFDTTAGAINFAGSNGLIFFISQLVLNTSTINFDGATPQVSGVDFGANTVFTTDAGGFVSKLAQSAFVSTQNTQTGYTAFANPATIRTCDTATVTTQQLAQLLGTLIEDLKAVLLPAT